ncbi:hypothetical protein NE237_025798 [Protea cynaroides]|uniref:Uncharacterized protein n=1 Tax=Protea cynaroides TaxID=273540 RepID=A0A9Q0H2J6_9MAGN|nr:hypothetical protein NE237_025798 [Protea cynaroides]
MDFERRIQGEDWARWNLHLKEPSCVVGEHKHIPPLSDLSVPLDAGDDSPLLPPFGDVATLMRAFVDRFPMARSGSKQINAKLVLLGDMGTGKTSLVLRFVKGQFYDYQESTIGAAFFTQVLSLNEGTVKFDIWDTAGQERYHSLAPMYYRGAAAAVVVYDISSAESFVKAKKWVQEVQRQGNSNLVMVLVANKADLEPKREVVNEEGELYAQENGLLFIETSAKTAQNVNELFYEIAKRLAKAIPSPQEGYGELLSLQQGINCSNRVSIL